MPVSEDDFYTDDEGHEYLETGSIQDDKRVYRTEEGEPYVERSMPMRIIVGAIGTICLAVGLFFLLGNPTVAAYGRWGGLLVLINSLPAGNLLLAAGAIVFGAIMLRLGYTGRDKLAVE